MTLTIGAAASADAGAILTVQRAAYVTEAQLYRDPFLPPLTETVDDVRAAITPGDVLVARWGDRLVGAVRGVRDGETCRIGRLVVAPDMQGRGIGSTLLRAIEDRHRGCSGFALFTGARSDGNLRLYAAAGYVRTHTEVVSAELSLVHLKKMIVGQLCGTEGGT